MTKTLSGKELLPDRTCLALLNIEKGEQGCLIEAAGTDNAACPDCGVLSTARHSGYWRDLKDLPMQGQPVKHGQTKTASEPLALSQHVL